MHGCSILASAPDLLAPDGSDTLAGSRHRSGAVSGAVSGLGGPAPPRAAQPPTEPRVGAPPPRRPIAHEPPGRPSVDDGRPSWEMWPRTTQPSRSTMSARPARPPRPPPRGRRGADPRTPSSRGCARLAAPALATRVRRLLPAPPVETSLEPPPRRSPRAPRAHPRGSPRRTSPRLRPVGGPERTRAPRIVTRDSQNGTQGLPTPA